MSEDFWTNCEGRIVKIFLINNYKYEGRIEAAFQDFVQIFDYKLQRMKIIRISQISDMEVIK
jgi:hypothetical protein